MHCMVSARILAAALLCLTCLGCGGSSRDTDPPATYQFDFGSGSEGWEAGFADLPVDYRQDTFELGFAHTDLPAHLGAGRKALLLSGHNRSDDLFMFLKRRFDGLQPSTTYRLTFDVEIASNAPESFAGIGGAPGKSVFVKVGAAAQEPLAVAQGSSLRMNIDKGNQIQEGRDMILIGDIGIPGDEVVYRLKRLDNRNRPFEVRTDAQGSLYVIIGTDSGFEGKTDLYYSQIRLTLTKT